MANALQKFGEKSESLASRFLKKQGYKILERNYRCELGEIDIIAEDKRTLVFVEVKSRKSNSFGNAKGAVTYKKQMKISMVALHYLKTINKSDAKARFDVVAITIRQDTSGPEIELIKNAFELAYT